MAGVVYKGRMSDEYQIHVPPSFTALYSDARGRLTVSLQALRERYELCEDLAHHLVDHCRSLQISLGDCEDDILTRCEQGLQAPSSGVSHPEARWITTRLAELSGWDWETRHERSPHAQE